MLSKRQVTFGVLVWLVVIGAFVFLSGPDNFVESLDRIDTRELAVMLVAVAAGVVAMGLCFYVLARNVGLGFSAIEAIFLNAAVSLVHNLTPFGQAGGVPIGAALISTRSDSNYEECLAALSMKDIVSFVPAILVFVFGGAYIAVYTPSIPGALRPIVAAFALMVVLVCAVVFAVYRYSETAKRVLKRIAGGLNRVLARLPLVPELDPEELHSRLDRFADSIGDIATHRKTVVLSSAFATSSFLAQGTLLWLTLQAVDIQVPLALAIFIVPVSLLASGLPLPGGTGGVEAVQILTILAVASPGESSTTAAVVLSRGLVFWTPIVLGSLTLLTLKASDIRVERRDQQS